jgi:hypothetical protein
MNFIRTDWTKEIPLGMSLRREDNIKLEVDERGNEDVGWINMGHDRIQHNDFVNAVMNLPFPQKLVLCTSQ